MPHTKAPKSARISLMQEATESACDSRRTRKLEQKDRSRTEGASDGQHEECQQKRTRPFKISSRSQYDVDLQLIRIDDMKQNNISQQSLPKHRITEHKILELFRIWCLLRALRVKFPKQVSAAESNPGTQVLLPEG